MLSMSDDSPLSSESAQSARDDITHQNQERVADDSDVITDEGRNQHKMEKTGNGGNSAQNQRVSGIDGVLVALGAIWLVGAAG